GWIDANTLKFEFNDNKLKIPHMGWNNVKFKNNILQPESSQLSTPRFYFVHSYYVTCKNETNVLATCNYGNEFHCGIYKENIFGVQFHPEKSHKYGMNLLKAYNNLI
ncbi:MAG: imidazole glycerol phosphate synthase subunit HisH, partial [Bacteroidia bacterium]|nr:imidazole glycerol phosphate synthase subunit HisH [Bacteroidia bacterium]